MLKVIARNLETVTILNIQGDIITGNTDLLREAVQLLTDSSVLILDLGQVGIIDAHGLGVLLELRERALARGARFKLMNVSKEMYRIFAITRLDSVFEMTSKVEFFPIVPRDPEHPTVPLRSCA